MEKERYNYWARYVLEREAMFLETAINTSRSHVDREKIELKLADILWAIAACKEKAKKQEEASKEKAKKQKEES